MRRARAVQRIPGSRSMKTPSSRFRFLLPALVAAGAAILPAARAADAPPAPLEIGGKEVRVGIAGTIQARGPDLGRSAMTANAASKPRAALAGRIAYTDAGIGTSCSDCYIFSVM